MKHALRIVALILCMSGIGHAQDHKSRFTDIRAQEHADPDAAFAAMMSLAEGGYAPAMDRVGFYYRRGLGTQEDLSAAAHWYARAVAAGHPWSTASLARVEIKLGRGDVALALLEGAALENRPGTRRLLASAHIDRHFGKASNPSLGREMLEQLAAGGDRQAARDLAVRSNWGRLPGPLSDTALGHVMQAGLEGDARFAEVALIYLTRQGDKSRSIVETRAQLAGISGIRDRVLSAERIRLAADQEPQRFWTKVEEVLADTEAPNYARAASTAFWINKNAWVRVLQKEMRRLGYYSGAINGLMTSRTIRAQNRLCRDQGIWNICATGPLRGPTVRAVAGAIASRKADL